MNLLFCMESVEDIKTKNDLGAKSTRHRVGFNLHPVDHRRIANDHGHTICDVPAHSSQDFTGAFDLSAAGEMGN